MCASMPANNQFAWHGLLLFRCQTASLDPSGGEAPGSKWCNVIGLESSWLGIRRGSWFGMRMLGMCLDEATAWRPMDDELIV